MLTKIIISYADFQEVAHKTWQAQALALEKAFKALKVEVELMPLPFLCDPERFLQQIVGYRMLPMSSYGDKLLCLGSPVQALRHSAKIVWLDQIKFFATQDANYAWLDDSLLRQIQVDAETILASNTQTFTQLEAEKCSARLLEPGEISQLAEWVVNKNMQQCNASAFAGSIL